MTREEAIQELEFILIGHPKTSARGQAVLMAIEALKQPEIEKDIAPVIHAKWEQREHKMMGQIPSCSHCGWFIAIETRYCPKCGAKMDGE